MVGEIDPRYVDLALALILLEAVALAFYHLWTRRGPAPMGMIANLLAGGFLLMVLREMLSGAGSVWIAASLAAALAAHGLDVALRWRGQSSPASAPRITRGAISLRATRRYENTAPKTPELETQELGRPHA